MSVVFEVKTIDRNTLEVVEVGTYTNSAACRALLRMKYNLHFNDVEQDMAHDAFEAAYEKVCPEFWEQAIAELARGEEIELPFNFSSFHYTTVVTVVLRNDSVVAV